MKNLNPCISYVILMFVFLFVPGCSAAETSQAEKGPKSLVTEEVNFQNGEVSLAGSLLFFSDQTDQPKPAVIFVPGSGPSPREFLRRIAEAYAAEGFITLIYDKRGSGASGGNWITSNLDDLAGDVVAGLEILANHPQVDKERIGIWAISQGGWVLPIAALKTPIPSWGIIMTGGGVTPKAAETFAYQQALAFGGTSEGALAEAMALLDRYFDYLATGVDRENLVVDIEKAKAYPWYEFIPLGKILVSEGNRPNWTWVATYDPVPDIAQVTFPTFVLLGANDTLASAAESAEAWAAGFKMSGVSGSEIRVFEGAGHGLVIGSHEAAMHGDPTYVDGYFETQFDWLRERGILSD